MSPILLFGVTKKLSDLTGGRNLVISTIQYSFCCKFYLPRLQVVQINPNSWPWVLFTAVHSTHHSFAAVAAAAIEILVWIFGCFPWFGISRLFLVLCKHCLLIREPLLLLFFPFLTGKSSKRDCLLPPVWSLAFGLLLPPEPLSRVKRSWVCCHWRASSSFSSRSWHLRVEHHHLPSFQAKQKEIFLFCSFCYSQANPSSPSWDFWFLVPKL